VNKTPGLDCYKGMERISISSAQDFSRCPRLYFYRKGCGLQELEVHQALTFGEGIHKAMPSAMRMQEASALKAFMKVWGVRDALEDPKRNSKRARAILQTFMANHRGDKALYAIIPPPPSRTPIQDMSEDEVPFAVDVGLAVPFVGKVDAVGRHRDTHEVYAVEYKTSSRFGSLFVGAFTTHPQVLGYTTALAILMEEEVVGCVVEALLVAKVKTDTLTLPFTIQDHQVVSFLEWLEGVVEGVQRCEDCGCWPKDVSACTSLPCHGMPGFPCRYQRLCMVEDWQSLKDMYRVERYDMFASAPLPTTTEKSDG